MILHQIIDGVPVPIGDDPDHNYAKDYRQSRAFTAQEATCSKCNKRMQVTGKVFSPLYGTLGHFFKCDCGAEVCVSPRVEEG